MGSNCGYHMLVALSILGLCIFVDEMTSYLVFAPKFSLMWSTGTPKRWHVCVHNGHYADTYTPHMLFMWKVMCCVMLCRVLSCPVSVLHKLSLRGCACQSDIMWFFMIFTSIYLYSYYLVLFIYIFWDVDESIPWTRDLAPIWPPFSKIDFASKSFSTRNFARGPMTFPNF